MTIEVSEKKVKIDNMAINEKYELISSEYPNSDKMSTSLNSPKILAIIVPTTRNLKPFKLIIVWGLHKDKIILLINVHESSPQRTREYLKFQR